MAQEPQQDGIRVQRLYEQPADALSLYSDLVQVIGTGHEVVLQFYESIPGPPGPDGRITMTRTRLRVNVIVSPSHAANIGRLLTEHSQVGRLQQEGQAGGQ